MLMEMSHTEIAPGKVVITLAGKLMMGLESEKIVTLVEDLLRQGKRTIIFDLSGVVAIDSTGIGRCISSLNRVTQAGGTLHMAGAKGQVRESFRVTRLDRVFRFFVDVPTALAAFG